jgi:hypothetical protein
MPHVQHTPEPYASTILSLLPNEQFRYRGTRIQAITVAPDAPYVVFSGTSTSVLSNKFRTRTPDSPMQAVPASRPQVQKALREALQRHSPAPPRPSELQAPRPRLQAVPPAKQHLAAPEGPAPTEGQQIRPPRTTALSLTPQPQHLAAPQQQQGRHRNV